MAARIQNQPGVTSTLNLNHNEPLKTGAFLARTFFLNYYWLYITKFVKPGVRPEPTTVVPFRVKHIRIPFRCEKLVRKT